MYCNGESVPKDCVMAYAYYNISASGEYKIENFKINDDRDKLEKEMTSEQIEKAQDISRDLFKKIEEKKGERL